MLEVSTIAANLPKTAFVKTAMQTDWAGVVFKATTMDAGGAEGAVAVVVEGTVMTGIAVVFRSTSARSSLHFYALTVDLVITSSKPINPGVRTPAMPNGMMRRRAKSLPRTKRRRASTALSLHRPMVKVTFQRPLLKEANMQQPLLRRLPSLNQKTTANPTLTISPSRLRKS